MTRRTSPVRGPGQDGWQSIVDGSIAYLRAATDPGRRRIVLIDGPAVAGWDRWRRTDSEHAARLLSEGLSEVNDLIIDVEPAAALLNGAINEGALWVADGGDRSEVERGLTHLMMSLRRR